MEPFQFTGIQDESLVFWCKTCNQEEMVRSLFLIASMAATVFSQTCSNGGISGCVNGLCGTGYTCTAGNVCCLNANVISCVDKVNPNTGVSDCPRMASYCTNSAYRTLMAEQCPKTCNLCGSIPTTTVTSCTDKVNPNTGVSDCPRLANKCNDSVYRTLMKEECPKTCRYC